jgi:hypothetical protein
MEPPLQSLSRLQIHEKKLKQRRLGEKHWEGRGWSAWLGVTYATGLFPALSTPMSRELLAG